MYDKEFSYHLQIIRDLRKESDDSIKCGVTVMDWYDTIICRKLKIPYQKGTIVGRATISLSYIAIHQNTMFRGM
jgi:hypothetical protein